MKRKVITLGTCVAAAIAMTACGKKGPTIEEVAEGLLGKPVASASYTIDIDIDADANYNMEDLSVSTGMTINVDAENIGEPENMRMNIHDMAMDKIKVNSALKTLFGADAVAAIDTVNSFLPSSVKDMEMYALFDDMKVYLNYNGWYFLDFSVLTPGASPLSNAAMDQEMISKLSQDILVKYGTLGNDLVQTEGEKCYTITMQLQGDSLEEYVESIYETAGTMDAYEVAFEQLETVGLSAKTLWNAIDVEMIYYAAEDDYHMVKTESTVKIDVLSLAMAFEDEIRASGFDLDAAKRAELTFAYVSVVKNIGNTTVEVPSTVVKTAQDLNMALGTTTITPVDDWDDWDDYDDYSDDEEDPYLNPDGSYSLHDYSGKELFTVYPVDGFAFDDGDYRSGSFVYYLQDVDYEYYYACARAETQITDLFNGEDPYIDPYFIDYAVDFTDLGEVAGQEVYLAHVTYGADFDEDGKPDYDASDLMYLIPYYATKDDEANGKVTFAKIQYYGLDVANWTDKEHLEFLEQVLGK